MDLTDQFWTFFAAVLAANLLTVGFVAGTMKIIRNERDPNSEKPQFGHFALALLPFGFLLLALL